MFNAPKAIFKKIDRELDLEGVIISGTNSVLHTDKGKCKSIFIGHGTGDKKYGGSFNTLETYDYHFISGPNTYIRLKMSALAYLRKDWSKLAIQSLMIM